MKTLLMLAIVLSLTSCGISTGPASNSPAPQTQQGTYYYHHTVMNYDGHDSLAYDETLTFPATLAGSNGFKGVYRRLDNQDTTVQHFEWFADGDLGTGSYEDCFKTPLPFESHRTCPFSINTVTLPTKSNGFEANGTIAKSSEYLGTESVVVGAISYPCSKVRYDLVLRSASGERQGALSMSQYTTDYWYSPAIGFIVKESMDETDSTSSHITTHSVYSRALTYFSRY